MAGRTIVITGGSDGIGAAAARRLAAAGERVVIVGRSAGKTEKLAAELDIDYLIADFAELDQVRDLAARIRETCPRIDVLANNAGGVMGSEREVTVDGHETTLQVNHLAPFLLTNLLLDRLIETHASVLNTSSIANWIFARFDIDDLQSEAGYRVNRVYGNSKLANILFTKELHRRHHNDGLATVAFHPGNVASNLGAETGSFSRYIYLTPLRHLVLVTPDQGADPLVHFATSKPGVDWEPGRYYAKTRKGKVNKAATDPELARRLWDLSIDMVGLGTAR